MGSAGVWLIGNKQAVRTAEEWRSPVPTLTHPPRSGTPGASGSPEGRRLLGQLVGWGSSFQGPGRSAKVTGAGGRDVQVSPHQDVFVPSLLAKGESKVKQSAGKGQTQAARDRTAQLNLLKGACSWGPVAAAGPPAAKGASLHLLPRAPSSLSTEITSHPQNTGRSA